MKSNQLYLLTKRRFLPLFIIQFCGCLNDNILKNALIILITYRLSTITIFPSSILVLIANTVFVLPFVIFASLAGQVADRYERAIVVRLIKFFEIIIIFIAFYGFKNSNLTILYISITLLGIHSTFFGPIKYSALPDQLSKKELLSANGFTEAGTFISILIGSIIGSYYNLAPNLILSTMILISIIGYLASFAMPKSNNFYPDIKLNFNIIEETNNIINYTKSKKQIYLSILGISWFWFIGTTIISQIPSLTKDLLGADETVATLFLATFTIGVGVGSFLCTQIFRNEITTKYIVASALGISLFGIDLFFAMRISSVSIPPVELKNIFIFLSKKHNLRIIIDLFFFAVIGGLYVVPLFTVIQYFSSPSYRSRIIAANNLFNSIFMAAATVIISILYYLNISIPTIVLLLSIANMIVAIKIYKLIGNTEIIPNKILKIILRFVFDKMYQVEVKGLENFTNAGDKVVIIANHISYIDPALIAVYLPTKLTFAINTTVSKSFWVKPFLKVVKALPLDPSNSISIKTLINLVKRNKKIAIFPEGRITTTGSLMKIYEGPGLIADKTKANILPIRIDGTQFTHFSKLKNIFKPKFFPRVTITILPPTILKPPQHDGDNKARRKYISHALYDIMTEMMFESSHYKNHLISSLIEAAKVHGYNKDIVCDLDNNFINYRQLFLRIFIITNLIRKRTAFSEHVGIMLPNAIATLATFYAILTSGRIPAMINFTSGASNIISCAKTANINIIFTSKKFIDKAELHDLVLQITNNNIKVIYLDDLKNEITLAVKFKAFLGSYFSEIYFNHLCSNYSDNDTAVILFTSGTENVPKAVALSHRNIQANRYQIMAKMNFGPHDIAFNALPMFHCFGLTGSLLMSLSGIKTFFYPSPLHYRIIPELIYDIGATIIFGTDTFLNGYSQYAHPYDFYSLRYIFAGAEKLKNSTRQLWLDRYGIRIFEGYGATETSPVLAANTPMHDLPGTVGRLMPKIQHYIEPVEGIAEGGKLFVKGPNIMKGYIKSTSNGVIEPPSHPTLGEGWYDTGDIVKMDNEGFITIIAREKRFIKIAGEMISLGLIEKIADDIDNQGMNASIYIEDPRRGEQIILFTSSSKINKSLYSASLKANSLPELYLPKIIIYLEDIPLLSTGKIDYLSLTKNVKQYLPT